MEKIYRLTGGHPFYTQLVCQSLISRINSTLKRNFAVPDDLHEVIQFIIRHPAGHIPGTWDEFPFKVKHTVAALANSLTSPEDETRAEKILQTAKERRFLINKKECYESISWLKKETAVLDWESDRIRFNIDIFRYWVEREYQTGEDIAAEENIIPKPPKPVPAWLKKAVAAAVIVPVLSGCLYLIFKPDTPEQEQQSAESPVFHIGDCVRIKEGAVPCTGWEKGMKGITGKITGKLGKDFSVDFPPLHPVVKDKVVCPNDMEKVSCD